MGSSMEPKMNMPWDALLKLPPAIKTTLSLAALAVVAIVIIVYRLSSEAKRKPALVLCSFASMVAIVMVVTFERTQIEAATVKEEARRFTFIDVTLVDTSKKPLANGQVYSSIGKAVKVDPIRWQLKVDASELPSDGVLTIYGSTNDPVRSGRTTISLANSNRPSVELELKPEISNHLSGLLLDQKGRPIKNVQVWVEDAPSLRVATNDDGHFELPFQFAVGSDHFIHYRRLNSFDEFQMQTLTGNCIQLTIKEGRK